MKKIFAPLFLAVMVSFSPDNMEPDTITFPSQDGITITADEYLINDTLPWMILCHQAGFSRGEYRETGGKFTRFGYNCLAVDLRSGNEVNGIKNETSLSAKTKKKSTEYLDAEQDIVAAINSISERSNKKIVLIGSSYSASLVLKIAAKNNKIKAVIAFSPGEYFGKKLVLKESIKSLDLPVFVTSSKEEAPAVTELVKEIKSTTKTQFTPNAKGDHGSRVLWKASSEYHEYWMSLLMFITKLK